VAILLSIVAGHDPADPGSADVPAKDYTAGLDAGIAGLVVGVPWHWLEEEAPLTAALREKGTVARKCQTLHENATLGELSVFGRKWDQLREVSANGRHCRPVDL
jgi:hypothetical protein